MYLKVNLIQKKFEGKIGGPNRDLNPDLSLSGLACYHFTIWPTYSYLQIWTYSILNVIESMYSPMEWLYSTSRKYYKQNWIPYNVKWLNVVVNVYTYQELNVYKNLEIKTIICFSNIGIVDIIFMFVYCFVSSVNGNMKWDLILCLRFKYCY